MKDIPVFTTEFGVAGLFLREIPYQKTAYIRLFASQEPIKLLKECISFSRMVGAETIVATGDNILETYPLYTAVWTMSCGRDVLNDTDAALWPVQEDTVSRFREIYNRKISRIPGAAWMTAKEEEEMIKLGEGYFIHRGDALLGIGRIRDDQILFLASLQKDAGADVVRALAHAIPFDTVKLEVASANQKAVSLYERLGFIKTAETVRWYLVV